MFELSNIVKMVWFLISYINAVVQSLTDVHASYKTDHHECESSETNHIHQKELDGAFVGSLVPLHWMF